MHMERALSGRGASCSSPALALRSDRTAAAARFPSSRALGGGFVQLPAAAAAPRHHTTAPLAMRGKSSGPGARSAGGPKRQTGPPTGPGKKAGGAGKAKPAPPQPQPPKRSNLPSPAPPQPLQHQHQQQQRQQQQQQQQGVARSPLPRPSAAGAAADAGGSGTGGGAAAQARPATRLPRPAGAVITHTPLAAGAGTTAAAAAAAAAVAAASGSLAAAPAAPSAGPGRAAPAAPPAAEAAEAAAARGSDGSHSTADADMDADEDVDGFFLLDDAQGGGGGGGGGGSASGADAADGSVEGAGSEGAGASEEEEDVFPEIVLSLPPPVHVKVKTAEYMQSCVTVADCPPPRLPEFAVIGRSNVGKSSLINMLTGRKDLALVSKQPGKTKCINHFVVNDSWYLVDLPGYGYAKVGLQGRQQFDAFTRDYFKARPNLAMVFLLVDASVPPQPIDLAYANWLTDNEVPFTLVFTKADKRRKGLVSSTHDSHVTAFKRALLRDLAFLPPSLLTSSARGLGRGETLAFIASLRIAYERSGRLEAIRLGMV